MIAYRQKLTSTKNNNSTMVDIVYIYIFRYSLQQVLTSNKKIA